MDAQIAKLQIVPANFNKEGEIDRDEYATLTLKIPMDTDTGRDWVAGLFAYLSREFVSVEVTANQLDLPGVSGLEAKTATQSVSLTAEDVDNQLEAAKEVADAAD